MSPTIYLLNVNATSPAQYTVVAFFFFFLKRVMPSYLTPLFNEIIFPIPVDLTGSISIYRIGNSE